MFVLVQKPVGERASGPEAAARAGVVSRARARRLHRHTFSSSVPRFAPSRPVSWYASSVQQLIIVEPAGHWSLVERIRPDGPGAGDAGGLDEARRAAAIRRAC